MAGASLSKSRDGTMQDVQPANPVVTEPFEIIRWKNAAAEQTGQTPPPSLQDRTFNMSYDEKWELSHCLSRL